MPPLFAPPPRAARLRVSAQYGYTLASLLRALSPAPRGSVQHTRPHRAAVAGPGLPQRRQRLRALRSRPRPARAASTFASAHAGPRPRHASHGL